MMVLQLYSTRRVYFTKLLDIFQPKVFLAFIKKGPSAVTGANIGRAVFKFFIVSGGGTILGIMFGFIGAFITK